MAQNRACGAECPRRTIAESFASQPSHSATKRPCQNREIAL